MVNFTGWVHPWKIVEPWEQGLSIQISSVDLNSATPSQVTVEDFIISNPYYVTTSQRWQRVNFVYQRKNRCITKAEIHLYLSHSGGVGGEILGDLFTLDHRYLKPKS